MKNFTLILLTLFFLLGCNQRYSPKPKGYLRINLDKKVDSLFKPITCNFSFIAPNYFNLSQNSKKNCWLDLEFLKHKATIHLTYKEINNNLNDLYEEARNMVYKHTLKADAINEKTYFNKINKTYGTLYDIHGQTASAIQFYITDSIQHFVRGALYFEVNTNRDSLNPIIHHLREDVIRIMETLNWEEQKSEVIKKTDK
ncbi:MAG: gliding motility lipoprotein GldD [Flavobacteriales bacterium]|nr:gliding motility lipoprotein GldD [Flavobacteriales bacterium]